MSVISFEDHSPRLLASRATLDVAAQLAEDFGQLIDVFERGRSRVQNARSLGRALEHYARVVRSYYQFRGVLSKIGMLRADQLRKHIPQEHMDALRSVETVIEQLRLKFDSPAPWMRATSLNSFRLEGVCRLGEASLVAERARRSAVSIASVVDRQ